MAKRQSGNRKNKQSNFAKLSIFQPNKYKFKKTCPLSAKGAPAVDYKNVRLLKKVARCLLKALQKLIIKILNSLKDMFQKMVKFYLLELQMLVKKNKESFQFQLKELATLH